MPSIPIRKKETNEIFSTSLTSTQNSRYCQSCNLKLLHKFIDYPKQKYIYSCPRCNVTSNIYNTEPQERLMTTFPTTNATTSTSKKKYMFQSENDRLSRSQYFYKKNIEQKNKQVEDEDPFMKILRQNNQITITNVDYVDPND